MALDVLTPFFGSKFYSTYENLCKKLRKIDLRSWISKKWLEMGQKGKKWSNFAKIVKNDL